MTSFVDALYSRFADPKYSECNSCELFIIGSLSPGKSGKKIAFFVAFLSVLFVMHIHVISELRNNFHSFPVSTFKARNAIYCVVTFQSKVYFKTWLSFLEIRLKSERRDFLTRPTLSHFHLLHKSYQHTFNCWIVKTKIWYRKVVIIEFFKYLLQLHVSIRNWLVYHIP